MPLFHINADGTRRVAWDKLLLWAAILGGAALRLSLIAGQRFHADEAIYGYWAQLLASGQDSLLLSVPLDKPPLFIYLLAGVFKICGPTEIAARLISQAAGIAAVPLTYTLGRRLYGQATAALAAIAVALSPFNILFAPTVFTDPLMVALILGAMNLAAAERWGWTGFATGLAVATKQQALFFIPLIIGVAWIRSSQSVGTITKLRPLLRMGFGFLSVMLILTGWDALRWRVRASFWEQSIVSHGPLYLVEWWKLAGRLSGLSELLSWFFASPPLNLLLLLGLPLLLWRSRRAVQAADWLLASFSALFFLLHWLCSFSLWDRYLLGLVPLASLLLARVMWLGARRLGIKNLGLAGLALALLLALPAARAVREEYPLGGDHGLYQGLEQVTDFFRHQAPPGSVLWHRYLGWHYFHYLFDVPLDLRWYAEPDILAAKASPETDAPAYIVFPAWEKDAEPEARAALESAGLGLKLERLVRRKDGSLAFSIYRLVPVPM